MERIVMENMVQDHEKRILALEQSFVTMNTKMTEVQGIQLQTQNTILHESKQTREQLNRLIELSFDYKKTRSTNLYTFLGQVVTVCAGAGGVLWALLEFFK